MKYLQSQKGSVLVLSAIVMVALIGFTGLVIDLGNLYVERIKMQNAADAATCAGGLQLGAGQTQAINAAKTFLTHNGFNPATSTITFTIDSANNPTSSPEINVSLTKNVPTYFMKALGFGAVPITVLAEGIVSGGATGPFAYAIYSADAQRLTLNYATYKGSIYSGGDIFFNGGGITVKGSCVAKGNIINATVNNNKVEGSTTPRYTDNISMPDFTSEISSTATIINANNRPFSISGNVTGSTYVQNATTLSIGAGTTVFTQTEVIMADGDIFINSGNVTLSGSSQILIYSRNGNITFNGGGGIWNQGTVVAYAPNGTINTGGGDTPFRSIIGKHVNIYAGSINVNSGVGLPSIPASGHVQLIK